MAFYCCLLPTGNRTLEEGSEGVTLRTTTVDVKGEAIVNNRKKKLIPSYELKITGRWTGRLCVQTKAQILKILFQPVFFLRRFLCLEFPFHFTNPLLSQNGQVKLGNRWLSGSVNCL